MQLNIYNNIHNNGIICLWVNLTKWGTLKMDMIYDDKNSLQNATKNIIFKSLIYIVICISIGTFMHSTWTRNLNLYHTLLEGTCVFFALAMFVSIWYNYERNSAGNCILALGFLAVAMFDILHATYFLRLDLDIRSYFDLSTIYWIIGRLTETIIMLLCTCKFKRRVNKWKGLGILLSIVWVVYYSTINYHDYFPVLLTSRGVTPIKIVLEYIIIILYCISLYIINNKILNEKYEEDKIKYDYILVALLMMIPSEICFTLYSSVESIFWTFGHMLKITSYYFLFRGVFISSITYSYEKLEIKHKQLEEAYKKIEQANMQIRQEKLIIQQQDKLAVLGQLGAGIVHETRNYLTTIKGRCQLIEAVSQAEKVKEYAKKINNDVNEVNSIISEFLFLSKPRETKLEEVSMHDIFESTRNLVKTSSLVQGINVDMEISKEERYLLCDQVQIKQVVLNICRNAVDAMAETLIPKLNIKTGYDEESNEMFIKITDNGKGMSSEDLEKVGTLFYTTKKNGTGLGLSVCYEIIKQHNGRIEIESKIGKGTSFTIILPCIKDDEFEEVI